MDTLLVNGNHFHKGRYKRKNIKNLHIYIYTSYEHEIA